MKVTGICFLLLLQQPSAVTAEDPCNYKALSDCFPPAGAQECLRFALYRTCAIQAGCVDVDSVQVQLLPATDLKCNLLNEVIDAPTIITEDGGVIIAGKKVCFMTNASDKVCLDDIGRMANLDDVTANLDDVTKKVDSLYTTVTDQVKTDIETIATTSKATSQKLNASVNQGFAKLQKTIIGLRQQVAVLEQETCGRHCYPGEFVTTPCSKNQNTVCGACPKNMFSAGGLVDSCTSCTLCSEVNQYKRTPCVADKDSECGVCKKCPTGKWVFQNCSSATDLSHCKPASTCVVGKTFQIKATTPTSDTVCQKVTPCKSGYETKTKATATKDQTCRVSAFDHCRNVKEVLKDEAKSGYFDILGSQKKSHFCEMSVGGGGWTLVAKVQGAGTYWQCNSQSKCAGSPWRSGATYNANSKYAAAEDAKYEAWPMKDATDIMFYDLTENYSYLVAENVFDKKKTFPNGLRGSRAKGRARAVDKSGKRHMLLKRANYHRFANRAQTVMPPLGWERGVGMRKAGAHGTSTSLQCLTRRLLVTTTKTSLES